MAKHDVRMTLQAGLLVSKGDVIFDVRKNGRRYGSLKVSQGAVVWRKKNNSYGRKLGWTKLQEVFDRGSKRRG